MSEFGEALKLVFARIADFFEIFDLSILLSGILVFTGLGIWLYMNEVNYAFVTAEKFHIIICIALAYLAGLLCFSAGRLLRREISSWRFLKLYSAAHGFKEYSEKIIAHGLNHNRLLASYLPLNNKVKMYTLRSFLWSEIRQDTRYGYSLSFLKKYWSMSIAFDSLLFATLVFDCVLIDFYFGFVGNSVIESGGPMFFYGVISLTIKYCLIKDACKYDQYQDDELLASFAALRRTGNGMVHDQEEQPEA